MRLTPGPLRASTTRVDALPSFHQFLHRVRVLSLYRSILRDSRRIADLAARAETRRFVRAELEKHRAVTDLNHGRFLLSTGRTEWERLERFIGSGL